MASKVSASLDRDWRPRLRGRGVVVRAASGRLVHRFPEPVQIHGAERAIVEAVAGLAGFAPDHAAVVGAHVAREAGVVIRLHDGRDVERAAARQMRGFLEIALGRDLHVADVREVNAAHRAELAHQRFDVVLRARAERTGAEREAVGRVIDDLHDAREVVAILHDARQTEDRARRIVGMDRHLDAAFGGHGHDRLEKVFEVLPQPRFVDLAIVREQRLQLLRAITRVPARQRNALARIDALHFRGAERETGRTVFERLRQFGAGPVEHRHEVVADHLHAGRSQMADGLLIVGDQAVAAGFAELDVLVHGHRLDHLETQARGFDRRLERGDLVRRPDLADRLVVNGRHDLRHARNLADVLERDRIGLAIPTERHFQSGLLRDAATANAWSVCLGSPEI
ncbi:hypothetical protein PT2222_170048 [Paraburkholderia tropica]